MQQKNIRLDQSTESSIFYFAFNMRDPVVGGESERARKLRRAIAIALNYEDYIAVFLNGRGIVAQSPLPPGIAGYDEKAIDPYVYRWHNGHKIRRSITEARHLLAEAGYANGINPKTGKALILNYDTVSSGGADDKAVLDWMRKQFSELGIELQVNATTYNRFQERVRQGQAQMFSWGWNADYPDPENFLFLLYGPNGKVLHGGENAANYDNPEFDRLFLQMKDMANGPERDKILQKMIRILQHDSPWVWGFHPLSFSLAHAWTTAGKPNSMANNVLKYAEIKPAVRARSRSDWNQAQWWPLLIVGFALSILLLPAIWQYYRRENSPSIRRK
jgi:ABC-type oligopeptide transport system substrate-binding subunit